MVQASITFALNPHGPLRCPRAQLPPSDPSEAGRMPLIRVVVLPLGEIANVPLTTDRRRPRCVGIHDCIVQAHRKQHQTFSRCSRSKQDSTSSRIQSLCTECCESILICTTGASSRPPISITGITVQGMNWRPSGWYVLRTTARLKIRTSRPSFTPIRAR